jgi:hypothetical protein
MFDLERMLSKIQYAQKHYPIHAPNWVKKYRWKWLLKYTRYQIGGLGMKPKHNTMLLKWMKRD